MSAETGTFVGDLSPANQSRINKFIEVMSRMASGEERGRQRFIIPGSENPHMQALGDTLLALLDEEFFEHSHRPNDYAEADYEIDQDLFDNLAIHHVANPVNARIRQTDELLPNGTHITVSDVEFPAELMQDMGRPISLLVRVIDFTPQLAHGPLST